MLHCSVRYNQPSSINKEVELGFFLNGQTQRRNQVIPRTDLECAISLVGVFTDLDFIAQQILRQQLGLGRFREVETLGLEKHLQPTDEKRLPQADTIVFLGPTISVREVDTNNPRARNLLVK